MFRILILIIFLIPIKEACAQVNSIQGLIKNEDNQILDFATVTLDIQGMHKVDKIANNGVFTFTVIDKQKFNLSVRLIGYKTFAKEYVFTKDKLLIVLEKDKQMQLHEVTIVGKKPLIERKIDRIIYNVENSIIANGSTVWDALNKAPGVQTKFDGNVTSNGKSVLIYIDDRPIRLSGDDLSNYLKSLPSDNIKKIEIISNPTSRYDAQGGAIINIISKKQTYNGLNTNVNIGYVQSVHSSYNTGLNFNYRQNRLNIYGLYSYSSTYKAHEESEYILFKSSNNNSYWDNIKLGDRKRKSNNYNLGVDYNLTKNQVIGLLINGSDGTNVRGDNVETNIYSNQKTVLDSLLNTNNQTSSKIKQIDYNINYKAKLDTSGQTLNIDFNYSPYSNSGDQRVNNNSYLPNGDPASNPYKINTVSKQNIKIFTGKVDYTYVFNKSYNLESGLKYSNIITNNHFTFFNYLNNGLVIDKSKSDEFEYSESTMAAYISLNASLGKLNILAGIRTEYTETKGNSIAMNSIEKNNYFKPFPTLFLTYSIKKDHSLNAYYGYRIERPGYSRLNPFKYYSSPYTFIEGNPKLTPAFIHNFELGYTFKQRYNMSLFYRRTNDYFSNITVQDNINKIFYDTQRNLDKSIEMGFHLSAPLNPTDWWEVNNFIQGSYKKENSAYLESIYNYTKFILYVNTNHAFIVSKKRGLKAELSAWYSSPGIQGIFKLDRTSDISLGLRKTLFDGQGSLRLAVSDIFYKNAYRINVDYGNQDNGFYEKNDTRSVSFSFSYKIGNKKLLESRRRKTSNDDEKNRTSN
ncbi:TonB-dependent receptor [Pedobacter cryoconitis]|uniref:Outer membrane receptor protein involved in Fe transport n=1 Tax=Pedobacter cryoconitis TaxID=188932 RepID=A0A327SGY6_9SPHI|nr:TonB-dependent receptor [Pedobacter cryoconitis]RAJ27214.1 outer membrane receptor protein involved in Fe transport [Pedobacter cryoconitis]